MDSTSEWLCRAWRCWCTRASRFTFYTRVGWSLTSGFRRCILACSSSGILRWLRCTLYMCSTDITSWSEGWTWSTLRCGSKLNRFIRSETSIKSAKKLNYDVLNIRLIIDAFLLRKRASPSESWSAPRTHQRTGLLRSPTARFWSCCPELTYWCVRSGAGHLALSLAAQLSCALL